MRHENGRSWSHCPLERWLSGFTYPLSCFSSPLTGCDNGLSHFHLMVCTCAFLANKPALTSKSSLSSLSSDRQLKKREEEEEERIQIKTWKYSLAVRYQFTLIYEIYLWLLVTHIVSSLNKLYFFLYILTWWVFNKRMLRNNNTKVETSSPSPGLHVHSEELSHMAFKLNFMFFPC